MNDLFRDKAPNFNLKEIEKNTILEAIRYTKGNLTFAKELLGISRASIYFLLKQHNIGYNVIDEIREK
jgi:transcriptional regulator of acetoin/glycerol metabolism